MPTRRPSRAWLCWGLVVPVGCCPTPPQDGPGDCSHLLSASQFENVTPKDARSNAVSVLQVKVDPLHSGTVYVATDQRGLFKSSDCGKSWDKIDKGHNSDKLDSGAWWSLVLDPVTPDVLYGGTRYADQLYKSVNGGVDWEPAFTDAITDHASVFQDVALDPTDPLHLAVTFHEACDVSPGCIGESEAGSWHLRPAPFGNVEGASVELFGPDTWLAYAPQDGVYLTKNDGQSYEDLGMLGLNTLYRAPDGMLYATSASGFFAGRDPARLERQAELEGGPIVSDGESLFVGLRTTAGLHRYRTAALSDTTTWNEYQGANEPGDGVDVANLAYDDDHHLLYSANTRGGLLRVVTR
jgi:hypothetical protein